MRRWITNSLLCFALAVPTAISASEVCAQDTFNIVYNRSVANSWPDPGFSSGHGVLIEPTGFVVFAHQVATNTFGKPTSGQYSLSGTFLSEQEFFHSTDDNYNFGLVDPMAKDEHGAIAVLSEFNGANDSTARLYMVRFSNVGDSLWGRVLVDSCFCGVRQSRRSGSQLASVGFNGLEAMFILADTTGVVDTLRTYPNTLEARSIAPHVDGGYAMAGIRLGGFDNGTWVMLLDSIGNMLWRRDLGGSYHAASANAAVIATQDGGVVVTCTYMPVGSAWDDPQWNYFRKWDGNGTVLWTKQYNVELQASSWDIEEMPDGRLLVSAQELNSGTGDSQALLYMLDANGEQLWLRRYNYYAADNGSQHLPLDVEPATDGGFVICGIAQQGFTDAQPSLQMIWLLKVDSFGCLIPGCQDLGVQEFEAGLNDLLVVSPNPAHAELHLSLSLPDGYPVEGDVRAVLTDALGQIVQEEIVPQSRILSHTMVLTPRQAPGIYYLHLIDAGKWLAGTKVIVE